MKYRKGLPFREKSIVYLGLGPLNSSFSTTGLDLVCFLRREVQRRHPAPRGDFAERSCDVQEKPAHIPGCKAMNWRGRKAGREKSTSGHPEFSLEKKKTAEGIHFPPTKLKCLLHLHWERAFAPPFSNCRSTLCRDQVLFHARTKSVMNLCRTFQVTRAGRETQLVAIADNCQY